MTKLKQKPIKTSRANPRDAQPNDGEKRGEIAEGIELRYKKQKLAISETTTHKLTPSQAKPKPCRTITAEQRRAEKSASDKKLNAQQETLRV